MLKQVIVIRKDLGMSIGKTAVQCSHASLCAYKKAKSGTKLWELTGQKKIILLAKDMEHIKQLKEKCDKLKIPCCLIADAGLTELQPGTVTALGIGPAKEGLIDKVTGSLPLLK